MTTNRARRWSVAAALISAVFCGIVMAVPVSLHIPRTTGSEGSTVEIPLMVSAGNGIGALQMAVRYDLSVLELTDAQPGPLLSGLVDFNVVSPGFARIAMATNQAVSGDGEIILMSFQVLGGTESIIELEEVKAWEQATGYEMTVSAEPGVLTVGGKMPFALLGGLALALLIIMMMIWRARKGRGKETA